MGRAQPEDDLAGADDMKDVVEEHEAVSSQSGSDNNDKEFHTEDEEDEELIDSSDSHDMEDEEDAEDDEVTNGTSNPATISSAPLLPAHLLQSEQAPQDPALEVALLTRKQKRAQSAKDRKVKRQLFATIRRDARGSGVLEAGAAARMRRGLGLSGDRVASGRVLKKTSQPRQVARNGRQQLLDKRKREEDKRDDVPLVVKKRSRTGSKR
nr:hypothetical protein CFP56_30931 [Quercus suber]